MSKGEARVPRSNSREPLIDYAGINQRAKRKSLYAFRFRCGWSPHYACSMRIFMP